MMTVYRDADIDAGLLHGMTVAVIGYGNQGHAHALNLRDSGVDTLVGARPGGSAAARATHDGFQPLAVAEAAARADMLMLSLPDEVLPQVYADEIAPQLKPAAAVGFAHGLAVHFGQIVPRADLDVFLVAPKGAGRWLRHRYEHGSGLAALAAVHQDASGRAFAKALAYAGAIGCGRAGIVQTSFKDECVTDLFGEQAVLCGGLPGLLRAGYETLVAAGYSPELAYFECVQEAKLIVDLIAERGFDAMRQAISNTAEYGGYRAQERLIDEPLRRSMQQILRDIEDGRFADRLASEGRTAVMQDLRGRHTDAQLEQAGRFVRGLDPGH